MATTGFNPGQTVFQAEDQLTAATGMDYKLAKEAFHSNNPGASIISINVLSLTALKRELMSKSAYAIYAASTSRRRPHPIFDYLTTVLPLLLGITLFANQPATFNAVLICIFGLLFNPTERALQDKRHAAGVGRVGMAGVPKSKGKWLDESDSDEEPAQPASTSIPASRPVVSLPSEVISASSTATSPDLSPDGLSDRDEGSSSRRRKRRSPSPSLDDHRMIDVLPTPEMLANGSMQKQQASSYPSPASQRTGQASVLNRKLPFLSVYRAHMVIMTIHCILAVDFPIFPRWLGKCEDFGTSLVSYLSSRVSGVRKLTIKMDVGVGSFVFSLGIVSTRNFTSDRQPSTSIWKSFKKALPILALGMIRVAMVKGVEYPEHVTEYGVHWNFFFTLALLPFLGTLLWPLRRRGLDWTVLGALITLWHQAFLSLTPFQDWVLSPIRHGLIGANKEGLASLPGYLAIYLLGLATGQHILRATSLSRLEKVVGRTPVEQAEERYRKRRTELALELFGYSVAWWAVLALCRLGGMGVSRRLANFPYVLWVAAYNSTFLLGYLLIESLIIPPQTTSPACPPLLEAINANGLVVFLAANLLTGLVNVSMQTMYARWYTAMGVLVLYSSGLCSLAWMLRRWRLKL